MNVVGRKVDALLGVALGISDGRNDGGGDGNHVILAGEQFFAFSFST